uniref:DM2 domain-containing protein n=1 Tax=Leersia perrieri TaxID=77586 RepID=A0A0D9XC58_9ORYZ
MFGNISKDSCGLIELSVRMQGKKQKGGGSGSASGFLVPLQLSDDLVKFIGTGESMLSPSVVVERMWDYVKENKLQVNIYFPP